MFYKFKKVLIDATFNLYKRVVNFFKESYVIGEDGENVEKHKLGKSEGQRIYMTETKRQRILKVIQKCDEMEESNVRYEDDMYRVAKRYGVKIHKEEINNEN